MKTLIFLIIISLHFNLNTKVETTIKEKLMNQVDCWNNGDLECFMRDYWKSDKLLFIGKSGLTYGWKNTLSNYKKNYPSRKEMGKLNLELIEVKKLDKRHYFTVGKWHLARDLGDLSGHFSLVWEKIDDDWVIIADHSI